MSHAPLTIELVRFDVRAERHERLVAGHAEARGAIHAVAPPGALWSRLLKLGERGWLEMVAWPERAVFETALEKAPADPVAGAWFGLADPGWSIAMGQIAEPAGPPPRGGGLELLWLPGGDGGETVAHPVEEGWSALVEVEGRGWFDPSGWAEREPSLLVLVAPPSAGGAAGSSSQGSKPQREVARIAHAVDSAEESGAPK